MTLPKHILVIRFSSLGDVAMTVPVLRNLLIQNPGTRVTFVSQPFFAPLFNDIDRLDFYPADVKKEYRGIAGLYKLGRRIKNEIPYDAIADLHGSLRSLVLRRLLPGNKAVIDKGRKEKKALTRKKNKLLRPLKTTFQRYAEVFQRLDLQLKLDINPGTRKIVPRKELLPFAPEEAKLIGIAPFARHAPKQYPLGEMKQVVQMVSGIPGAIVLLFGSREEARVLDNWEKEMSGVHSCAGKFGFADELNVISQLQVMCSMDSANMHLASLFGVPVVSIWGATHPFTGFYGWGQSLDLAIQADLPCRPSSVFGNKPCPVHGDSGCMDGITPGMIENKIKQVLKLAAP